VVLAREKLIVIQDIDLTKPLSSNPPLDLLITKFNIELNATSGPSPNLQCQENLKNFTDYLSLHPQVIQLDPLQCQETLTSRQKMLELFQQLSSKVQNLYVPQSVVITNEDPFPRDFPYPAICKTLEATGALSSHEMGIIWDENGLSNFPRPLLLQQLINHSSTIFKVFVIGDYYYIVKRPSIKNLTQNDGIIVKFNSQEFKSLQGQPTASFPPKEFIGNIVQILSNELGLTLIGLDIITCSSTGKHYIIDANYFPGYTGVEDCPLKFLDLLIKKLKC